MPKDTALACSPTDHPSSSIPTFEQLARTPLIPETVLKRHGAYCAIDTRFRAAARLLQCLWLREQGIPAASSDDQRTTNPHVSFGSILCTEAANAGRNFLAPEVHRLALQEWLLCEDGAAIDDERLFGNALSSMPLVFNLFAPLAMDRKLATSVFQRLLPGFVHKVERIHFEHSPGRRNDRFLSDRTAFDLAVHVTTPDQSPAIIYIEVKYSESMEGPAARMRDRYNEASKLVHLYRDPNSALLRSNALEQLWREHMLAQIAVDNGITTRAVFMAIGPRLNRRAQAAFRVYQSELVDADKHSSDRVGFVPLTLETVIETIAAAGACDMASALWKRYCNFELVYRLAMQELAGDEVTSPEAESNVGVSEPTKLPHARARRRLSSANRSRTKVASSTHVVATKATATQGAI